MAIPNPERELQRLEREIERGLPPCLLLLGPSGWFRTQAFERALAKVPPGAELRIVDGTHKSDGKELGLLRGGALFARAACLAVRRADDWLAAHAEELERLVPKIAKGSALLLETPKLDRRTRLGKLLVERALVLEFRDLYAEPYGARASPLEAELVQWLVQKSRASGIPVTPEAAFVMLTVTGKEPRELVAELDRLRLAFGKRTAALSADELRGRLNAAFESTPFELAEALLARDRRRATRSLHAMFARGVRDRDGGTVDSGGVFPFVTSWLLQAIGQVLAGRRLLDQGVPARDVAAQAGVRVFQERFQRQVEVNDRPSLERMLEELLKAQRDLRLTAEEPQLLLEGLLARCLG